MILFCIQRRMFMIQLYLEVTTIWYHMHIESCLGALHTFDEVVKCVIFDYVLDEPWWFMCIGEIGELCTWWNLVNTWRCVLDDVCYFLWYLDTWWFWSMMFILVNIMRCELYVCDSMISSVTMIALLILLKWWFVFVKLFMLNKKWGEKLLHCLMFLSDELLMMNWFKNEYAWYDVIYVELVF